MKIAHRTPLVIRWKGTTAVQGRLRVSRASAGLRLALPCLTFHVRHPQYRQMRATFIIVLAVCAAAYAIAMQATGQHAAAEWFVMWAGGGLMTFAAVVWFLSPDRDD